MRNEASSVLRGPILVDQDQLKEAYALLEEHRNQNAGSSKGVGSEKLSIEIELWDEQKYTLDNPDDCQIENRRKNPIIRITMRSFLFPSFSGKD